MSRGILSWGDFVLGGILSRGILSGGFCPGGFCPGGFCPDTRVSACCPLRIYLYTHTEKQVVVSGYLGYQPAVPSVYIIRFEPTLTVDTGFLASVKKN